MKCLVMTKVLYHVDEVWLPCSGVIQRRKNLLEKIGELNRFAVVGYHRVVCDAFIHCNASFGYDAIISRLPLRLNYQEILSK